MVGFGCDGPDEFLQSIFGGWQDDRAGGVGMDPEHQDVYAGGEPYTSTVRITVLPD
ncbi:hypothetical protein [Ornithinimicrobium pekingense]|uniref:GyrI-like small molecule binding domain-containing protein n=1 Tax=Ornithinimicrobium pekingense TaxID=384677 RepID=A0ABQ2F4D7_9MICO|nr:hypothetical protein [Ornithinimicrobium pekingense]GGK60943.1 hypothetical protein GCM10011509_06540 [Ornithinimicrobium pekingense]